MKNKGFTLVEILAVIVILAILTTMATLGVTRYRRDADQKDLLNLHDALQTSFANYRSVLAMNGDVLSSQTITISSSQSSDFDRYIQDLSYNGKRLNKSDLEGTTITIRTKGDLLQSNKYKEKTNNLTKEDILIKDATCIVISDVTNPGETDAKITKSCKKISINGEEQPEPSKDELICIKVKYNNEWVIDDYGKEDNTFLFNELCQYVSE